MTHHGGKAGIPFFLPLYIFAMYPNAIHLDDDAPIFTFPTLL
jgi:hypothetical protein